MAIRANKALRGAVGVFCLSGGQENSGGHVRRGNKKTGWMETQQCTNTPKHQTNEGRHKGSETERTCHPTTCAHTHTYSTATHSFYLGFYHSPLVSSLFKTLTLTYSSNDARWFPTHMQNSYLKNKTETASGRAEASGRLMTKVLKCGHGWNLRSLDRFWIKIQVPLKIYFFV